MSEEKFLPEATIYIDGACFSNPGPGGWAAVIITEKLSKEIFGGFSETTNNRMELKALIEALKALNKNCKVSVITDSRYLHDALNKGWLRRWLSNGWKTSSKKPVKNRDLWQELIPLLDKHKLCIQWTKAHQGLEMNERCDFLAKKAASMDTLPNDPGY